MRSTALKLYYHTNRLFFTPLFHSRLPQTMSSNTTTTQTALLVTNIGHPVTSNSTWPIPSPGPKQIQLRVTVGGLNPHDQKGRDIGLFISDDIPAILGSDIVGVVTALGSEATRFKIGDKVFGQGNPGKGSVGKALQEVAVLDEEFVARVPGGVSDDEAATLPTNLLAAVIGFYSPKNLALPSPWSSTPAQTLSSSTILIIGGGTNCGRFATQLASLTGFTRIVVVGGSDSELTSYGATHIVDRHGGHDAVLQRIRDIVGDDLEYAFDAITPPSEQDLVINALSNTKKGAVARLLWSRGQVDEAKLQSKKAGYELKNVLGLSTLEPEVSRGFWENIGSLLVGGKIKPLEYEVVEGLDAGKVNEVLDRYRDGKKVVQTHFRISE